MFKWKPAAVQRRRAAPDDGAGHWARRRSCCSTAQRHLRMRKLMLPPFHGEAIAHYAELIEQITNREIDGWRAGPDDPHAHCRADDHDGGDHPRGLRDHRSRARSPSSSACSRGSPSPNPLLLLVQKDLGPRSPWGRFLRRRDRVDALLYEEIEPAPREPDGDGARRHPHAAAVSARRGRQAADRPRAARRADHAPARRARDHRDLDRLGVRAPAAHPARARAPDRRGRGGRERRVPRRGDQGDAARAARS